MIETILGMIPLPGWQVLLVGIVLVLFLVAFMAGILGLGAMMVLGILGAAMAALGYLGGYLGELMNQLPIVLMNMGL